MMEAVTVHIIREPINTRDYILSQTKAVEQAVTSLSLSLYTDTEATEQIYIFYTLSSGQNVQYVVYTHNHHKHHGTQIDDEEEEGDHG